MRLRSSEARGTGGAAAPSAAPTSAGGTRRLIGRILDIPVEAAETVVARQAETGRLFGDTAVEMGMTSQADVQRAVEEQQGFSVLPEGDERLDPLVVSAFHPDDPLARAVRGLRSTIVGARREDGASVQSVGLLGLDAAAETSILAANLAVACAQANYRTLLVDANMGHAQHHALFRVRNRSGLSTILSTGDGADLAPQPTAIPSLALITAGPPVPNGPELFERQRLAQFADQLADGFDILLVDAANAGGGSISACLGLDAAIVVLRRDVSGTRAVQEAIDRLQRHGTIVLGTVLTE